MTDLIHTAHDHFFRQSMCYPQVAKEFLQTYLPADILHIVEFESLRPEKDTYIDKHLKASATDMLYSVNINGAPGFIYILVEHQRACDPLMPFRIVRYIGDIIDQHLKKAGGQTLPLVYPLILYNGQRPYTHTTDIFKLFKHNERLAREIFMAPFDLIDLTQVADEDLKDKAWASILLMLLKHAADRKDVLSWFNLMIPNLTIIEAQGGLDYIHAAFTYLFSAHQGMDTQPLMTAVHQQLSPQIEETVMTIGKHFEEIGMKKGMEKGIEIGMKKGMEKGVEKGVEKGQKMIAARLLAENILPPEKIAQLSGLSLDVVLTLKASKVMQEV